MSLKPKVVDNKVLHLLSCLAYAHGHHLCLSVMTTGIHEVAIYGDPHADGLPRDLLCGGQGYSLDEAIENCFLDCKDNYRLLGSEFNPCASFNSLEELDINLTLMGFRPSYEPVCMQAIDLNKWEAGLGEGNPPIIVSGNAGKKPKYTI